MNILKTSSSMIMPLFTALLSSCASESGIPVQVSSVPKTEATQVVLEENATSDLDLEVKFKRFSYNSEGLRDPFRSVISRSLDRPKAPGALPPLQRSEVADLKLKGIVWGEAGPRAIVNTPDGKGYTVKVGTRVGMSRGVIKEITQNKLVVVETVVNVFGESKKRKIIMDLHPQREG